MHIGAEVRLTVHRGVFNRSFAKFGKMDPFIVLSPNQDPSKTQRARVAKKNKMVSSTHPGGNLKPEWEWTFPAFRLDASQECIIDVYDRNHFHKNTYMGSTLVSFVTLNANAKISDNPCSVVKKEMETGIIWVSLEIVLPSSPSTLPNSLQHIVHDEVERTVQATACSRALSQSKLKNPQSPPSCSNSLDVPFSFCGKSDVTGTTLHTQLHPATYLGDDNHSERELASNPSVLSHVINQMSSSPRPTPKMRIRRETSVLPACFDGIAKYLFCKTPA